MHVHMQTLAIVAPCAEIMGSVNGSGSGNDVHLEQNGNIVWRDQSGEQDVRRALALDDQAAQLEVGLRACGRTSSNEG